MKALLPFDVNFVCSHTYTSLRVLKRLGFTSPFVRRARYFRANLSEDCYAPFRVLQD
jgi:hypothetical protein